MRGACSNEGVSRGMTRSKVSDWSGADALSRGLHGRHSSVNLLGQQWVTALTLISGCPSSLPLPPDPKLESHSAEGIERLQSSCKSYIIYSVFNQSFNYNSIYIYNINNKIHYNFIINIVKYFNF